MAADYGATSLPTEFLEFDHFGTMIEELHLLKDLRAHISEDGQDSRAYRTLIRNRLNLLEHFPRADDEQPFSLEHCFMISEIWVFLLELGHLNTDSLPSIDALVWDVHLHLDHDELENFDRLNVPDQNRSIARSSAVIFNNALREALPKFNMEPKCYFYLRSKTGNDYSGLPEVGGWDTSAP